MKKLVRLTLHALLGVVLCVSFLYCVPQASAPLKPAEAQTKHYVCPACGQACDNAVYDHPGTCPVCGMQLVPQGTTPAPTGPGKRVAIVLFDHAEIIDFSGPYEVFGAAGFDVYTVGETTAPVTTAMGMKVVPKYAFADAPQPDILVVPGGGVDEIRANAAALKWLRDTSGHAEQTMSVCNGAFILASAGLLDGLAATTTYGRIRQLATEFPKTKVVRDQRFVDNGKIITTAGLSSGIDGALHVVEKTLGKGAAELAALGIEYDWHRDSSFVRAALADHLIPSVEMNAMGDWTVDRTEGTRDRWDLVLRGTSPRSAAELMAHITHGFTEAKWRSVASSASSNEFRFEDDAQKPWTGTLTIESPGAAAAKREYVIRVSVARGG
jgi:putative intracellular protease/amidase